MTLCVNCIRKGCIADPNDPYHAEQHLCFVCGKPFYVTEDKKICPKCNWVICPECGGCQCNLSEWDASWVRRVRGFFCQAPETMASFRWEDLPKTDNPYVSLGLGLQLSFCKRWAVEQLQEGRTFKILGKRVQHPISAEEIETFPAPKGVSWIELECNEVTSLCPVTGQPDFVKVVISYLPDERCIETKSLKLYLWSFRDRGIFAESLSKEILDDLVRALKPHEMVVETTYQSRGGIVLKAIATHSDSSIYSPCHEETDDGSDD